VLFLLLAGTNLEAQCAMCKAAAETSAKNDPESMAKNLNTGILYLMAVPYLALCFIFRKQIAQLWKKLRGQDQSA
jgi:hypothetical protein